MQFLSKYSLKKYHTFATDVYTKCFTEINSIEQFKNLLQENIYKNNSILILGGGSNLLFTKNFDGLVIKNNLKLYAYTKHIIGLLILALPIAKHLVNTFTLLMHSKRLRIN